jgi:RNA polymerase sigma-70 factor (ECF subfamily)
MERLAMATVELRNWGMSVTTDQRSHENDRLDEDALDAELVAAALRDRSQFAALYRRYQPAVYSYCRRRLDEQDAEDATSHIFVQAMGHLESCRSPSFRAWLFRIAHNVVVDFLRRRKPSLVLDERLSLASGERSPEDVVLSSDLQQRLARAIDTLPPDQRAAVELRLAGFTGVECAEVLGKRPEAVRMLQHRAFGTLRTALNDLSPGTPT